MAFRSNPANLNYGRPASTHFTGTGMAIGGKFPAGFALAGRLPDPGRAEAYQLAALFIPELEAHFFEAGAQSYRLHLLHLGRRG